MSDVLKMYAKVTKLVKKIKAIKYLGGVCLCCNEDNFFKLAFHHKEPHQKEKNVVELFDCTWGEIEKEAKKCILLCHNCHVEEHYVKNKNPNKPTKGFKNKQVMLEFKGEKSCNKCGYDKCTEALEFHHLKKENKNFKISSIYVVVKTIHDVEEKIIKELNMCDVLCKNCHVEEHSDVLFFEQNKEYILNKVNNYKGIQKKINRDEVYKMFDEGVKQVDIAKHFKASKGTISDILKEYKKNGKRRIDKRNERKS